MTIEVNATLVKELREKTGVGFMECKKALVESNGDLEGAIKILRERGIAKAEKRSGRATAEGLIALKVAPDFRRATMVELNCETDFVARNENFRSFLAEILQFADGLKAGQFQVGAPNGETSGEAIAELPFPGTAGTLREAIVERIAKTGENMSFRRFACYESPKGFIAGYIHPPGKIGVMVELNISKDDVDAAELEAVAKDVAMHIAASAPRYLQRADVDAKHLESEQEIYANKSRNEGKPEKIIPNIVKGMVEKFYKDVCLVDQPFVKEPAISVGQLLADASKKHGKTIQVVRFVRFQVG